MIERLASAGSVGRVEAFKAQELENLAVCRMAVYIALHQDEEVLSTIVGNEHAQATVRMAQNKQEDDFFFRHAQYNLKAHQKLGGQTSLLEIIERATERLFVQALMDSSRSFQIPPAILGLLESGAISREEWGRQAWRYYQQPPQIIEEKQSAARNKELN